MVPISLPLEQGPQPAMPELQVWVQSPLPWSDLSLLVLEPLIAAGAALASNGANCTNIKRRVFFCSFLFTSFPSIVETYFSILLHPLFVSRPSISIGKCTFFAHVSHSFSSILVSYAFVSHCWQPRPASIERNQCHCRSRCRSVVHILNSPPPLPSLLSQSSLHCSNHHINLLIWCLVFGPHTVSGL